MQGAVDCSRPYEAQAYKGAASELRYSVCIPIQQSNYERIKDTVYGLGGEERIHVGYVNYPTGMGEGEEMNENPKYVQALKEGKPRMEYLVGSVLRGDAAVHAHGADKYGERNWRQDAILASTYEAAILRHFMAYFYDSEDLDPDSGHNHLYHIRACCAVMLDAEKHGTLIDNRGRCASNFEEKEYDRQANHSAVTGGDLSVAASRAGECRPCVERVTGRSAGIDNGGAQ
jgi:hypothetical protein